MKTYYIRKGKKYIGFVDAPGPLEALTVARATRMIPENWSPSEYTAEAMEEPVPGGNVETVSRRWYAVVESVNRHDLLGLARDLAPLRRRCS